MTVRLQEIEGALGCPELVDPLRRTIRTMLVLGAYEDAIYLVRSFDDTLEREGFMFSADGTPISPESGPKFSQLACENVKAAYCTGPGGAYELSAAQHRALVHSGNFMQALESIARGLFPEEVIQRAIGAEVRLHVNGV